MVVNIMHRSEQLASLRDIFFSEMVCMPPRQWWIDDLVAIGAEVVREFHFDAVTVEDLKHQAFIALGEYTDTFNNHWDDFEDSAFYGDSNFVDDFDGEVFLPQETPKFRYR